MPFLAVPGKSMIDETIVAVVADHGGYRNTHGITPPMIAEVYVPLLLRGMIATTTHL